MGEGLRAPQQDGPEPGENGRDRVQQRDQRLREGRRMDKGPRVAVHDGLGQFARPVEARCCPFRPFDHAGVDVRAVASHLVELLA